MPAEWEPQSGVMLTWPHAETDWADHLEAVEACYFAIAEAILRFEALLIVCCDEATAERLGSRLHSPRLNCVVLPANDTWARDHGPITVMADGVPELFDFKFNGWGLKFAAHQDNQLTRLLHGNGAFSDKVGYRNCLDFVMEGGAIESDGEGTLLTTTTCLLSANRNEQYQQHEVEAVLKLHFGLRQVLWLTSGYLAGDDTDSHIDTLARLCTNQTIAYVQCLDTNDVHYPALKQMEQELAAFRRLDGQPYRLVPLPMADAVYDAEGERLPATYANFLILNGAVLLPFYGSPKDEQARAVLQTLFPEREIIGINCLPLIEQHGSLHCVTMQFPEGTLFTND